MSWFLALLIVLAMGGVAAVAAGRGGSLGQAYDDQMQRWVDAARTGIATGGHAVDGPGSWDGYAAAAICEAGVSAVVKGERIETGVTTP